MPSQKTAKVQHYVPQFLLRNFSTGKKHQVHVFDKRTKRTFFTKVKNVAAESRFYDFEFQGHPMTLEPSLSELEGEAKLILDRIIKQDSLSAISPKDRKQLSVFFAVQLVRTLSFKKQWLSLSELLVEECREFIGSEAKINTIKEHICNPDENRIKMDLADTIINAPKDFAPYLLDKAWLLLKTDRQNPFILGDNPITLQNIINDGPRGGLGLAVQGIEIYLPLSPTKTLALFCHSHEERFRKAAHNFHLNSYLNPNEIADNFQHRVVTQMISTIENEIPLPLEPEHVTNLNSLQISHAERYIFANVCDFSLAQQMLTSNPKLRIGPRLTLH